MGPEAHHRGRAPRSISTRPEREAAGEAVVQRLEATGQLVKVVIDGLSAEAYLETHVLGDGDNAGSACRGGPSRGSSTGLPPDRLVRLGRAGG